MRAEYIPGRGYTVRDSRGLIVAHSLTPSQRDALMRLQHVGGITSNMLLAAIGAT